MSEATSITLSADDMNVLMTGLIHRISAAHTRAAECENQTAIEHWNEQAFVALQLKERLMDLTVTGMLRGREPASFTLSIDL